MLVKFNRPNGGGEVFLNAEKIVCVDYGLMSSKITLESMSDIYVEEMPSEVMAKIQNALVPATLEVTTSPETLTMRDHFAMAVLPKLALTMGVYSAAARHAYEIADEMLIARDYPVWAEFSAWANTYFPTRLNTFLPRTEVKADYMQNTKWPITSQEFFQFIRMYAITKGYTLNPEISTNKEGRIIRKHNGNAVEMLYLEAEKGGIEA